MARLKTRFTVAALASLGAAIAVAAYAQAVALPTHFV